MHFIALLILLFLKLYEPTTEKRLSIQCVRMIFACGKQVLLSKYIHTSSHTACGSFCDHA